MSIFHNLTHALRENQNALGKKTQNFQQCVDKRYSCTLMPEVHCDYYREEVWKPLRITLWHVVIIQNITLPISFLQQPQILIVSY